MRYLKLKEELQKKPKVWLITGVAGFIGSNLLEELLKLNQKVIGLDNFSTGSSKNLESVKSSLLKDEWNNFEMHEGDIVDFKTCETLTSEVNYVLHQAALGSVPRSLKDPINTNNSNIVGFLNILYSSMINNVDSFVYAASSSTYGDHKSLPKVEDTTGNPLSPYAVTKLVNELYATVFARTYEFKTIGLRYFNVFGRSQDPNGSYAAVIPRWIDSCINGDDIFINGDGETSRDFCYIDNVVQINLLAATAEENCKNNIFNVALGDRTSLNELYNSIQSILEEYDIRVKNDPIYRDFRPGDVRHSQADISKAKKLLGYEPSHKFYDGLKETIKWYLKVNS